MNIASIRKDYKMLTLDEASVDKLPSKQFEKWWAEVVASQIDEMNAMVLSTVNEKGEPSSRVVLLKGFDSNGLVFFTNYHSAKASDISHNNHVSLLFFWKELERQVRINGTIQKIDEEQSDNYFKSRPEGSKLGAWASPQSEPIPGRELLNKNLQEITEKFEGREVERPPHWGGYVVMPNCIEFWQGRADRLHDRIAYFLQEDGGWEIKRLAP